MSRMVMDPDSPGYSDDATWPEDRPVDEDVDEAVRAPAGGPGRERG